MSQINFCWKYALIVELRAITWLRGDMWMVEINSSTDRHVPISGIHPTSSQAWARYTATWFSYEFTWFLYDLVFWSMTLLSAWPQMAAPAQTEQQLLGYHNKLWVWSLTANIFVVVWCKYYSRFIVTRVEIWEYFAPKTLFSNIMISPQ
jgi:hypothetical protein